MKAQLSLRIPRELNEEIGLMAKRLRMRRSDVVRLAIERFFSALREESAPTPYSKVEDLIGSVESGVPDLGERHREYLLERIKKDA